MTKLARIVKVRSIQARFSGPPYRMSIRYGYRSGGTNCSQQRKFDDCYVAPPRGRTRDNGVLSNHFANWCVRARKVIHGQFLLRMHAACSIVAYIHA